MVLLKYIRILKYKPIIQKYTKVCDPETLKFINNFPKIHDFSILCKFRISGINPGNRSGFRILESTFLRLSNTENFKIYNFVNAGAWTFNIFCCILGCWSLRGYTDNKIIGFWGCQQLRTAKKANISSMYLDPGFT